jgi:hypothetical protein
MDNEQLEFDFSPPEVCKCTEITRYDDLCSACLKEVLEFMAGDDELDLADYEEHA